MPFFAAKSTRRRTAVTPAIVAVAAVLIILAASGQSALCQTVSDSMMSQEEQARGLERDISGLEAHMASMQRDWVTISRRLEDVQKRIMDCYLELDQARAELARARAIFDTDLRLLYMRGRPNSVVDLLESKNVTDMLVKYDYLARVAARDSSRFESLKEKEKKFEDRQAKLEQYKKEKARLERSADTSGVEAQLAVKKQQLANVNAQIIAMQLPATMSPAPTSFDPGRLFTMPNESSFKRTGQEFSGYSSWYGAENNGRSTASGEVFDEYAFTCAHNTLPFGTWLRVTFKDRSVIVKVNDRGPSLPGRVLDLSRGAAQALGLTGVQWVDCEIVVPRGS